MKITLDIDEDVLQAVKNLARRQNISTGQIVSQILRLILTEQDRQSLRSEEAGLGLQTVAGFRPFPAGKAVVTNDAVNRLRIAEGL